jgi:hypothetical protein
MVGGVRYSSTSLHNGGSKKGKRGPNPPCIASSELMLVIPVLVCPLLVGKIYLQHLQNIQKCNILIFVGHISLDDPSIQNVQNKILFVNNAYVMFPIYIVCHHINNIKLIIYYL